MARIWVVEYRMSSVNEWRPRSNGESSQAFEMQHDANVARDDAARRYGDTLYRVSEYVRVERKKKGKS